MLFQSVTPVYVSLALLINTPFLKQNFEMSESKEKGIDYVLQKTFKNPIHGIHDLPKLKDQFIPLDNLTSAKMKTDIQTARQERRNVRRHAWKNLSTRSFRKAHMKINKSKITFESIKPIADLWDQYATRVNEAEINISKMDLHGAPITVTASRDSNLIGVSGRVLKESYGAIVIVSEDNKVRQVNKSHSVIELKMPNKRYEINLDALKCRPYQRPTKKWKNINPLPLPF